jgi:hypothetical protein
MVDPGGRGDGPLTYLPDFFSFFAARFSFRFFWAAFLEAFPPPLSFDAMRQIYRVEGMRARAHTVGISGRGPPAACGRGSGGATTGT